LRVAASTAAAGKVAKEAIDPIYRNAAVKALVSAEAE